MKKMISSSLGLAAALGMFGFPGIAGSTSSKPRPLAQHRKNPKDPHQAKRIEMAKAKRERKAAKLRADTSACYYFNPTTGPLYSPGWLRKRREPFFIAK